MEENVLKIKCSYCGAVLAVKTQANVESKVLTCPVCKSKAPFLSYKRVSGDRKTGYQQGYSGGYEDGPTRYSDDDRTTDYDDGPTQYAGRREETEYAGSGRSGQADRKTEVNLSGNCFLGRLKVAGTGQSYQLKPGRNVVGRKAQSSSADFQIAASDNKRLSREHLVIEVKKVLGKGFVHQVSLFKERCNRTMIGRDELLYGDCIILRHGDRILLPGLIVDFEIPDGESTEM